MDMVADIIMWMYLAEIVLKMYGFGIFVYLQDPFHKVDTTLVIATIAVSVVLQQDGGGIIVEHRLMNDKLLQVFRCIRILRILRNFTRFRVIIRTFIAMAKSFVTLLGVQFCVYYVYAIIGMALFGGVNTEWTAYKRAVLHANQIKSQTGWGSTPESHEKLLDCLFLGGHRHTAGWRRVDDEGNPDPRGELEWPTDDWLERNKYAWKRPIDHSTHKDLSDYVLKDCAGVNISGWVYWRFQIYSAYYYINNFNRFIPSLITLMALTIVNNFQVVQGVFVFPMGNAYHLYFISFFFCSVLVVANVIISFILDSFVTQYEARVDYEHDYYKVIVHSAIKRKYKDDGYQSDHYLHWRITRKPRQGLLYEQLFGSEDLSAVSDGWELQEMPYHKSHLPAPPQAAFQGVNLTKPDFSPPVTQTSVSSYNSTQKLLISSSSM